MCIAGLYVPALLRRCWHRGQPGRAGKLGAAAEGSHLNPSASLEGEAVAGTAFEASRDSSQHKLGEAAAGKGAAPKGRGELASDPRAGGSGALLLDQEWDLDLMSEADAGAALGQPGHLTPKGGSELDLKMKAKG